MLIPWQVGKKSKVKKYKNNLFHRIFDLFKEAFSLFAFSSLFLQQNTYVANTTHFKNKEFQFDGLAGSMEGKEHECLR